MQSHKAWLRGGPGGRRANFSGSKLDGVVFRDLDLRWVLFSEAALERAKFVLCDLRYANFENAFLYGAEFPSAHLEGARFHGAYLRGAEIGGKTVITLLRRAMRSDGYEFFLWHCKEGFYIQAGCRFFSYAESRRHWDGQRVGEDLGDETQDILDMFNKAIFRAEQL
jgi:hypothetical protein